MLTRNFTGEELFILLKSDKRNQHKIKKARNSGLFLSLRKTKYYVEKYTRRNCWSCVWKRRHHAIAQGCGYVYPFPEGMDQNNMDHIASYLETAPLGAFFMVIVAHLGGAFLGARHKYFL